MAIVRRLLTFLAIGALLGAIVSSLVAPQSVVWFNTAGDASAMCNCVEIARHAAESIIRWQLIGAAIGGGLFLILGIVLSVRGRGKNRPRSEPSGSAPTVPPPAV